MDDFMKEALEIVRAQARVRMMTEDEIVSMVSNLAVSLRGIMSGEPATEVKAPVDAKKSIKEKSVTCLECGKSFKVLTKKHLASHGLTSDGYKEKYGLPKKITLVAKELVRTRRKKMGEMRLWERRKGAKPEAAATQPRLPPRR